MRIKVDFPIILMLSLLFLPVFGFSQLKDVNFYANQYHNDFENKELSPKDSIKASTALWAICAQTITTDFDFAKKYAGILYQFASDSNEPHVKLREYQVRIGFAYMAGDDRLELENELKLLEQIDAILETSPNDSTKIEEKFDQYKSIGSIYAYQLREYELADSFLNLGIEYANRHQLEHKKATIFNTLGILKNYMRDYPSSIMAYDSALYFAKIMDDSIKLMRYSMNKAIVLFDTGEFNQSTEVYLNSLALAKELGQTKTQSKLYLNIHYNHYAIGDTLKALECLDSAEEKYKEVEEDSTGLCYLYSARGDIYIEQRKYEETKKQYKAAKEMADAVGSDYLIATSDLNLGRLNLAQEKGDDAIPYFINSLNIAEKNGYVDFTISAKLNLVDLYFSQKKYDQAGLLLKTMPVHLENMSLFDKSVYYDYATQYHKSLNQYEQAYQFHVLYKEAQDSILNENNIRETAKLESEFLFQQEKTELELQHLAQVERQRMRQMGLLGGLLALLALAILLFIIYRNKAKSNQLLKAKNDEILEQKEILEQVNYTKDRLFAILGHDLRKPTISFRGIAKKVNYLLKKQDYDRLEKLGKTIEDDAQGLATLTDNLLKWALTQKEALSVKPENLFIRQIINEEVLTLNALMKDKELGLEINVAADVEVLADKESLHTIIRNLLDNAIKYSHPSGKIFISAKDSFVGLDLRITDQGVGIPSGKLDTIFLLQEGKSTKGTSNEKGTGLGLHLVHELIKLNQGKIKVISTLGEGSTFEISLPKAA